MDVLVSAVVLIVFMRVESRRVAIHGRWYPVLALVLVGVSLALPLYLYLRNSHKNPPLGWKRASHDDRHPDRRL